MEAAHIAWRPLGQLLVEQGMLTSAELEHALATQQQSGKRLGETIVECGFVSGPELATALAAQYGIELTTEKGFGTGLRSEIQRRHEHDRRQGDHRRAARLAAVPEPRHGDSDATADEPGERALPLPQLEEQWAKLAAAEAALAERKREVRRLAEMNDRLREQLERLRRPSEEPAARREAAPAPQSHLVFLQLDGRYELVSRHGPPPLASTELVLPDLDEGRFVVAGSRPSPLPGDSRPCVFAQRV